MGHSLCGFKLLLVWSPSEQGSSPACKYASRRDKSGKALRIMVSLDEGKYEEAVEDVDHA